MAAGGGPAGAHRITPPVPWAVVGEGHSRADPTRSPAEQVAQAGRVAAWQHENAPGVPLEAAYDTAFGRATGGMVPQRSVVGFAAAPVQAGVDAARSPTSKAARTRRRDAPWCARCGPRSGGLRGG